MSNDFLAATLRTLRQHMEVWACLDIMKSIASALFSTHGAWKARGVQSRELIQLLLEVDHGQHLEPAAREQLFTDQHNFTRVRLGYLSWSADADHFD